MNMIVLYLDVGCLCLFLDFGLHGLFIYEMVNKHVCSRSVALYASCTPEIHGALITHSSWFQLWQLWAADSN